MGKNIFLFLILFVLILGAFFYFKSAGPKSLKLIFPQGNEEFIAGKVYQVKWKARKIERVGLALVNEEKNEKKWIAENLPAKEGKFDWKIFVWENPGQNYRLVIFEYPWEEGKEYDYSKRFTISGPTLASCDSLSIENQWPFIPSDFLGLKRVFITKNVWNGDLGGLEGADKKCQEEAKALGLEGNFKAFLGDDQNPASERLDLEGVFVEAEPAEVLPLEKVPQNLWESFGNFLKTSLKEKGEKERILPMYQQLSFYFSKFLSKFEEKQVKKTCYRLIAKDKNEFLRIFSDPLILNQARLSPGFLENFSKIWLGRITTESQTECLDTGEGDYSFTVTCQNWRNGGELLRVEKEEYPVCYTPIGERVNARTVGGLSLGWNKNTGFFSPTFGANCSSKQRLICLEQ